MPVVFVIIAGKSRIDNCIDIQKTTMNLINYVIKISHSLIKVTLRLPVFASIAWDLR